MFTLHKCIEIFFLGERGRRIGRRHSELYKSSKRLRGVKSIIVCTRLRAIPLKERCGSYLSFYILPKINKYIYT